MQKGVQKNIWLIFVLFAVSAISQNKKNLLPYVNAFIGTDGQGNESPGVCYPFGMMQLSPVSRHFDNGTGYKYSDNLIYSFAQSNDDRAIMLMPLASVPSKSKDGKIPPDFCSSSFIHFNEKATPGYYSVLLDKGNIKADLTASERGGIYRYIFAKEDSTLVALDLNFDNKTTASELTMISDTEVSGYSRYKDHCTYFDIRCSRPIETPLLLNDGLFVPLQKDFISKNIKALFQFKHTDTLLVKIGVSSISAANASVNLSFTIPAWDFEGTLKKTQAAWNNYLHRIEVTSHSDSLLTTFYTALYHTAIHPSLATDVNGEYKGQDNKIYTTRNLSIYNVPSLSNTYGTLYPLYTIITPSMDMQFIQSILKENKSGSIDDFSATSIIYDAFIKRIYGYDPSEALEMMERSATENEEGQSCMLKLGYVPSDKSAPSVSKTLEYSYYDWCTSMMAKAMGRITEYENYIKAAQGYKNIFDPTTALMRARSNGSWFTPFSPTDIEPNYSKGNAWQNSFYAPHDINGLIQLYGGKEKLEQRLDSAFNRNSQNNEPSLPSPYLYNCIGKSWKTTDYVRRIEKLFTTKPDGLCDDDSYGQLSSWYVLSAIGLYPACPGDGQFVLTSPLFDSVKIHLENGKTFSMSSYKETPNATYINSSAFNYKNYQKSFLPYDSIMKGGSLNYVLSRTPPTSWGMGSNAPADSIENRECIVPQPYSINGDLTFKDSLPVELKAYQPTDKIYYTLNDSTPDKSSFLYTHSFCIKTSSCVKSIAVRDNKISLPNTSCYIRIPKGRTIKISSTPSPQYTAGGPESLLDYQHGTSDFRLGKWQGYRNQNFEATVDLGKEEMIKTVKAEFLQDINNQIFIPDYVEFSVSQDGRNFNRIAHLNSDIPDTNVTPTIKLFRQDFTPKKIRYVKVFAKGLGKLCEGNLGFSKDSYLFIDEIIVK